MTTTRMTRRLFLAAAMGAGGSVALARIRPWSALVRFARTPPAMRLVAIFGHPESARAVGRAYLAGNPTESSPSRIAGEIARGISGSRSILEEASDTELRELLVTRIGADFSEERVVDVDGWILSSTEARLCALAALAYRPAGVRGDVGLTPGTLLAILLAL